MTDTLTLRKLIEDSGLKLSAIMEALDIKSYATLRAKINNVQNFTAREIQILCVLLDIPVDRRDLIFFATNTEFNSVGA